MILYFLGWERGGNDNNAVFKIQKKCLRLITEVKNRVSFRSLFGDLRF
jgi:hypothetical protein